MYKIRVGNSACSKVKANFKNNNLRYTINEMKRFFLLFSISVFLFASCKNKETLTPEEAKEIAKEAYVYGFPMVVAYKTMWAYTIDKNSPEFKGDFNEKGCEARVYTAKDKAIVTPNSDTPYCMFWADLRNEPLVITVPDVDPERYYGFQLIDLYTHNFAYVGTLSTGNNAGKYLITEKGWSGEIPDGIDEVFACETDLFFVIVRVQLFDVEDIENVKQLQESLGFMELSAFLGEDSPNQSQTIDFPVWNEGDQFTAAAFGYIDFLLNLTQANPTESELREKFKKLNIGTKGKFEFSAFSEEVQNAIEEGIKEGFHEIETFIEEVVEDPISSSKAFGTRDFLEKSAKQNFGQDNIYLLRSAAAHLGLFGNSGEEAIYPTYLMEAPGTPYNGADNDYVLVFEEYQLPPVKAFWSITMYDGATQLLVDNPLDKYLVNSNMLDEFVYGEDGSLTLYIQKDSPGKELETNWLPAPNGPFYCVLRLYGPKEEALSGVWNKPPMVKNN